MNYGILAMGEGLTVALIAAQILFNLVVGVILANLASRRAENTKLAETVDQIRMSLASATRDIANINARLERGDEEFDATRTAKQNLELKTQAMITELQLRMATRADLDSLAKEFQKCRLDCLKGRVA